ncbi:MAG: CoA ester lyase [Magnetococcales bacterium]|nr:CoA ester lyase [Magnetococcales bacterium]
MKHTESRLLRSVLYVPASQKRVLEKAPKLKADALILDLEDSVSPQAKAEARQLACETLLRVPEDALVRTVRINGLSTDWWSEDITTVFPGQPDGIVVPKVDGVESLKPLDDQLSHMEKSLVCEYRPSIWAMIESPLGVINAHAIASHPRVSCLVMGTSDLIAALGVRAGVDRSNLAMALQQSVLAAKAAGVPILDGVFLDLKDGEGFETQCREGAGLGFAGKTVIHPSQVGPANALFLPSDDEIARARNTLVLWRKAQQRGEEICLVEGVLVERLHARRAAIILKSVGEISDFSTI